MIKTFEIDLDDKLVDEAGKIFETLGTDIDTAIKMFLTQATLRKGFPFDVAITEKKETALEVNNTLPDETFDDEDSFHSGISEEEENELAMAQEVVSVSKVSPAVSERVAKNEALVEQMRAEIGNKSVTPEFDEGEEEFLNEEVKKSNIESAAVQTIEEEPSRNKESEEAAESSDSFDEEDEDETTPENLFDSWDVGDEEDVGCR